MTHAHPAPCCVGLVPGLQPECRCPTAPSESVPTQVTVLPHHVVLKNGREDIVCACGEHFRWDKRLNDMAGPDAIQQWVKHYRERESEGDATQTYVTPPERTEQ